MCMIVCLYVYDRECVRTLLIQLLHLSTKASKLKADDMKWNEENGRKKIRKVTLAAKRERTQNGKLIFKVYIYISSSSSSSSCVPFFFLFLFLSLLEIEWKLFHLVRHSTIRCSIAEVKEMKKEVTHTHTHIFRQKSQIENNQQHPTPPFEFDLKRKLCACKRAHCSTWNHCFQSRFEVRSFFSRLLLSLAHRCRSVLSVLQLFHWKIFAWNWSTTNVEIQLLAFTTPLFYVLPVHIDCLC